MTQKGFVEVGERFDEVNKHFGEVDKRFDGIDKRLDHIENLILTDHRNRLERLEDKIHIIETAIKK